jgi:NAD(P)-dependent dehydrogenase (short-subunit alcohol dehydrogenase family)
MAHSLQDKVVLITGVSSGLGRELAVQLLNEGAKVAGTVRNLSQISEFEALSPIPGNALGVQLDVTDDIAVQQGVEKVLAHFGSIDYLANNAGAGKVGAIEETSIEEAKALFDLNFFGSLRMIQAVLPSMRQRQSGHIIQFSAIGGFKGVPGLGVYAAAKGAMGILGESLAEEVNPLGIQVSVLTIGIFHTQFAGSSLSHTEKSIDDYAKTPVAGFKNFIGKLQGKQPNDPVNGAKAIINIMKEDHPPLHVALGGDAIEVMRSKMSAVELDIQHWEANAKSAAFIKEALV